MRTLFFLLLMASVFQANAQNNVTGNLEMAGDVGKPAIAGSHSFNAADQSYSITGAGYNIWFARDEFYYLYRPIKGDFLLTANFSFTGNEGNTHRKTGWMLRTGLNEDSPHISATLHGDGHTVLQWRDAKGGQMVNPDDEVPAKNNGYDVIQLERRNGIIYMRAAKEGFPFEEIGSYQMINLPDEVYAGIFVCSHDPKVTTEVKAWNVRIDKPVADDYNAARDGAVGCRLETMDVFTGKRMVIFEKDGRFEAPNWMPDGKKLLFNMNGLMYKIPVSGGETELLNTGKVTRNNNDHGISFNGKLLALSGQQEGVQGGSSVFIVPLKGGEPVKITDETPSYWHGWNPNNKEVVYVAQRGGKKVYNIYRNSIKGGKETQLTDIPEGEHVDGCEYSPDGKYIYYNGSHTGNMQLWRIKADGTGREQLTFDDFKNWFPHISPDGKWIAFISFPSDIEKNSHPSYKRVLLRIMPAEGGEPKVIAYLYGGQGTINVPSWSPDSRQIAFVSNSGTAKQ